MVKVIDFLESCGILFGYWTLGNAMTYTVYLFGVILPSLDGVYQYKI